MFMAALTCVTILVDPPAQPATGTLDIEVLDAQRADARAVVVGRASMTATTHPADPTEHRCVVHVPVPAGPYEVQAHWALAAEEQNARGNYRTMERIAISEAAWRGEESVELRLRPIH